MEVIILREVQTPDDLKEEGCEWYLNEVPFHILKGAYICKESTEWAVADCDEVWIRVAYDVGGRVFVEEMRAWEIDDGVYAIPIDAIY